MDNIYHPRDTVLTAPRDTVYLKLPYLGDASDKFTKYFKTHLSRAYPQLDFKFILYNNFSIGNFFKIKDPLPWDLRSNIIYEYKCDACQASYIGCTTKQAKVRYCQHSAISHRTNRPINNPVQSSIREHCDSNDHPIKPV